MIGQVQKPMEEILGMLEGKEMEAPKEGFSVDAGFTLIVAGKNPLFHRKVAS